MYDVAVIHYFLSPLLVAHGFIAVLLSNLLFMVAACYYHYLNFLGYDGNLSLSLSQNSGADCLPWCPIVINSLSLQCCPFWRGPLSSYTQLVLSLSFVLFVSCGYPFVNCYSQLPIQAHLSFICLLEYFLLSALQLC